MSGRSPKPADEISVEHRLSMRLSDENLANAKEHKARLEKVYGTEVSRSQAIESLMTAGALVWRAAERTGSWSPTALVDAGKRIQLEAREALEAFQKQERKARTDEARAARAKKGS